MGNDSNLEYLHKLSAEVEIAMMGVQAPLWFLLTLTKKARTQYYLLITIHENTLRMNQMTEIKEIKMKNLGIEKVRIDGEMKQLSLETKINYVLSKTNQKEYQTRQMWHLGNPYNEVIFIKGKSIHPQALGYLEQLGVFLHQEKEYNAIETVMGCQIVILEERSN